MFSALFCSFILSLFYIITYLLNQYSCINYLYAHFFIHFFFHLLLSTCIIFLVFITFSFFFFVLFFFHICLFFSYLLFQKCLLHSFLSFCKATHKFMYRFSLLSFFSEGSYCSGGLALGSNCIFIIFPSII